MNKSKHKYDKNTNMKKVNTNMKKSKHKYEKINTNMKKLTQI